MPLLLHWPGTALVSKPSKLPITSAIPAAIAPDGGPPASWWLRRFQGKILSTLRILKATLTFDGALEYLLWKIQRHSGIYIQPTELQRKYPGNFRLVVALAPVA